MRTIRLATKDVEDHLDTPRVRLNKKSGLLDADGENVNRSRGEMWRISIPPATNHIENIDKQNMLGALVRVPDLVAGFFAYPDHR